MPSTQEEQLREQIWDRIFRGGPKQLGQLADDLDIPTEEVERLTDHEWFDRSEDWIANAQTK